ncbi:MAG: fluoride efflux transporter CrcB [Candidatus Sumerlaeaceae bacterium]|nr:fluoride efflux transporter CrcB [Candidatus Sumerlaeaceae bacterium]
MLTNLILVAVGGAAGAVARYLVARGAGLWFGAAFPWGTFIVNVSGSFALGLVATLVAERAIPAADSVRLAVAIGFLGAFTTFSTFEYESDQLLRSGEWLLLTANVAGSLLAGFIALRLGIWIARGWQ